MRGVQHYSAEAVSSEHRVADETENWKLNWYSECSGELVERREMRSGGECEWEDCGPGHPVTVRLFGSIVGASRGMLIIGKC